MLSYSSFNNKYYTLFLQKNPELFEKILPWKLCCGMLILIRGGAMKNPKKALKKQPVSVDKHGGKTKENIPQKVRQMLKDHNSKKTIRVFVAGGARPGNNPKYEKETYNLGVVIGRHDYQLTFGLSSRGIMGAVAKGVLESWKQKDKKLVKPIQGVTTEHYQSLYPEDDMLGDLTDVIVAHTLEERKKSLLNADFVVFAPGGLGTLDELAYDCIAMQDGLLKVKPFVLFNVDGFFHHLLEYLKDIHLKGFSDQMPFIVVDNVFETEVAFAMIAHYRLKIKDKQKAATVVEKIIHELPYVIEQRQKNPGVSIGTILRDKDSIFKSDDLAAKQALSRNIETAYLTKEIQRMYDRLATTGRDTALVSHKLSTLKERMETTRN